MQTCKHILAIDPSGSFEEGKGTTGFNVFSVEKDCVVFWGAISALDYPCKEAYWDMHLSLLDMVREKYTDLHIVIEDYLLYANKATDQINSRMETPRLLGLLQHYCWKNALPLTMQNAVEVMSRWANEILIHKGYLLYEKRKYYIRGDQNVPCNRHVIDSIRHAVHFAKFKANK